MHLPLKTKRFFLIPPVLLSLIAAVAWDHFRVEPHLHFKDLRARGTFFLAYLLNGSPSRKVLIGKKGWFFYAGREEMDDICGGTKMDGKALNDWATSLELKRRWLAGKGIRYLFVIAPNKSTVYREYLPGSVSPRAGRSDLDLLVKHLGKNTKVTVLDLRDAVKKGSEKGDVYYRTDSHWNDLGAHAAYEELMKPVSAWFPGSEAQPLSSFTPRNSWWSKGDLAGMLGWQGALEEEVVMLAPSRPQAWKGVEEGRGARDPIVTTAANRKLPRALVFRDSFFTALLPMVAGHFQYARFEWRYWDATTPVGELVRAHRPDIVIEEVVERNLSSCRADFAGRVPAFGREL